MKMKLKSNALFTVAAVALAASLSVPVTLYAADTTQETNQPGSGFESLIGALNPDQGQSEKIYLI
jgi:hypothetical protein